MQRVTEAQRQAYVRDGGFKAEGLLSPEQLKQARACFDWGIANPGPLAFTLYKGTELEHYVANSNPGAYQNGLEALFQELSLADYARELWDSEHVWCSAPIDTKTPERHTLVVRFFGDDAVYSPLPGDYLTASESDKHWIHLESRTDGAPFRSPAYPRLR